MVSRYGHRLSGEQFPTAFDPPGPAVAAGPIGACGAGLRFTHCDDHGPARECCLVGTDTLKPGSRPWFFLHLKLKKKTPLFWIHYPRFII